MYALENGYIQLVSTILKSWHVSTLVQFPKKFVTLSKPQERKYNFWSKVKNTLNAKL